MWWQGSRQNVRRAGNCVSRSVRDHVHGRLDLEFDGLGRLRLKSITHPVEAFVLRIDPTADAPKSLKRRLARRNSSTTIVPPMPSTRYCTTTDCVRLAYMTFGDGLALVIVGHWFSHLRSGIRQEFARAVAFERDWARADPPLL